MAAKNKSNKLFLTRIYDAPVKAVWEAWTDPEQVAKWWGPRGFTLTHHAKDLKPGGIWHYTMHGPDGTDYPNKTFYHEVEKYKRLVYDHGGYDDRPPLFRVIVEFTEIKGKTKLDFTMTLDSPEKAEEIRQFIKKAGGESTWDRLDEYLGKQLEDREKFVINRSFDAPIDVVYDMWTNPKHFPQWMGPAGSTMEFIKHDIRPGGSAMYMMINADKSKMYGQCHYIEFKKPTRIQYTQNFCDKKGHLSRHPMAPTWPAHMKTTVDLFEEGPDRTRVRVTWDVHGDFTKEEMAMFISARAGMTGGWTGSFDKLEAYLESQR